MTSYNKDNKVGAWALEKLKCLGDYLSAYTQIMKNQTWCDGYFYIDAFAGAGKNEIRGSKGKSSPTDNLLLDVGLLSHQDEDEESYVNGSTYVALDINQPFTKYFLVDLSEERVKKLNKIKKEYEGQREIEVIHNDATLALSSILKSPDINWKKCRGVVFLDPFGMQVPWSIIEEIARNGSLEIFLNLPVGMAIQRLLPRSGKFTKEQKEKLTEYFGSPEWEDIIYHKTTDLFGEENASKADGSGERLALWYQKRLENVFGFSPAPRLITNSHGTHLYYLLFAGPNETGAKIASHVLKQGKLVKRSPQ